MKFYQDNQEIDLSENPNHTLQVSVVDNDTFSVAARVVFAIPNQNSENFQLFERQFQ
jgi:hypothetical protein